MLRVPLLPNCLHALVLFSLLCQARAEPPITLELAKRADNNDWIRFADPAGILDVENGITDGEAAEFDLYGKLLVTASKADGRHPSSAHGKTSHLRVWNSETGEMIWDVPRHPGQVGQPGDGEDEIEIALFSPDGKFVAAGGEDDEIQVWRIREDHHGPDEWITPAPDPSSEAPAVVLTATAAIDGMAWSHDGRLLLAGVEDAGKVMVFRTQGDPSTWQLMHTASHGGQPGWAVNSLDVTSDDRYVGTIGTDTIGKFWRLDVAEDGDGLITSVNMVQLATLPSANGKAIDGSGREARFEPNGDRHFITTLERTGIVQVYDVQELIAWPGPNTSGPDPIQRLRNGLDIKDGNEVEPAAYSNNGRFLVHDGDTRVNGDSEGIFPGFFRIYETAQIQPGVPDPDPVYLQKIQATEYLGFNPDDTELASGHGDGTVRKWNVTISGTETIRSEAFNETTATAGRWTLEGSQSAGQGIPPETTTESFDVDPGWAGLNNTSGGNDFGFRNSDELGEGAGVAGGAFDRAPADPAYYADVASFTTHLDENGVITASGKLIFGEQDTGGGVYEEDANQDVLIGHFKEVSGGSADPRTHAMGIYIQEPNGDPKFDGENDADEDFRVSAWIDVPGYSGANDFHTRQLVEGVAYDFEYTYDPAGDGGNGTFTVTVNGDTQSVDVNGSQNIDMDAFGMTMRNRDESATAGDNDYNVFIDEVTYTSAPAPSGDNWGSSSEVSQGAPFRGHRGRRYLAADDLDGETHAMEIDEAWDISGFGERQVQFAAVAAPGVFEAGDYLRLLADMDGDDTFETTVAEFLPDGDGDLAQTGTGAKLNAVFLDDDGTTEFYYFTDFFVDLESLLPGGFGGSIRFRVEASTDAGNEEIGFDSLRVTGRVPGYQAWTEKRGLTPGVNDGLDFDANADGIPNRIHFAFDTDPLGDGTSEGKRVFGRAEDGGGDEFFTCTFPVRKGASFSGDPLASDPVDGLVYRVLGDDDLDGDDLAVVERSSVIDTSGLPELGDYDGVTGPDYEYRSFRFAVPTASLARGFMWEVISEAP